MAIPARIFTSFLLLAALIAATAIPLLPPAVAGPREASALEFQDGRIAFHSHMVTPDNPTGDYEIFTMDANGGDVRQLTKNTGTDAFAVWSPDGSKLAFSQDFGLTVMDADGTNLTRLNNNGNLPTWSPDGARIAFERVDGGVAQLYVMDANGANETRIDVFPSISTTTPDWSPDGQRIAFASLSVDLEYVLFTVRPNGADLRELPPGLYPSWSPDGAKIAFSRSSGGSSGQGDVFVMKADGSEVTNLTNSPGVEVDPDWSPSGDWITYVTYAASTLRGEISTMRADGSQRSNLTNSPDPWDDGPSWQPESAPPPKLPQLDPPKFKRGDVIVFSSTTAGTDFENLFKLELRPLLGNVLTRLTFDTIKTYLHPAWSPDGSKIAFSRREDGRGNIYTMNANGTNVIQLTNAPSGKDDLAPSWSPDGARIVFSSNRDSLFPQLFIMGSDGSNLTNLTNAPQLTSSAPDWSPDGAKIVFNRLVPFGALGETRFCLFTINPDGTGLMQLTSPDQGNSFEPAWSPDGRQLVLSADDAIYTVKANGTSLSKRTSTAGGASSRGPNWSPNPAQSTSAVAAAASPGESAQDKQPPRKKDDKHKHKNKQGKNDKQDKSGNRDKQGNHGKRHAGGRDRDRDRDRGARQHERAQASEPRHAREQRDDRRRRG